jgi:hypothetical protein
MTLLEYPSGTDLFSAPDSEETMDAAKQYISENGLTWEHVRLVRRENQIVVVRR